MVIDAVLRTGVLQNQFETGQTNGFAVGEKGDVRVRRESALFGAVYDDAEPRERPKYGAADLFCTPRGGWPRFGSSFWVLDPSINERATVTIPGSHSARAWWGTWSDLEALVSCLRPGDAPASTRHRFHRIDGGAEIQVHGQIRLESDVTTLVLDPSFRNTRVADVALRISRTFGIGVEWCPALYGDTSRWSLRSARMHASRMISCALMTGEPVSAEWIGRDVWACRHNHSLARTADGASRYVWNRLLLESND